MIGLEQQDTVRPCLCCFYVFCLEGPSFFTPFLSSTWAPGPCPFLLLFLFYRVTLGHADRHNYSLPIRRHTNNHSCTLAPSPSCNTLGYVNVLQVLDGHEVLDTYSI